MPRHFGRRRRVERGGKKRQEGGRGEKGKKEIMCGQKIIPPCSFQLQMQGLTRHWGRGNRKRGEKGGKGGLRHRFALAKGEF